MMAAKYPASRTSLLLQVLRHSLTRDVMDTKTRLARARFRAWHRGTREADYLIGNFFEHHHGAWREEQIAWFETLLDQDDIDVLAWAMRAQPVPEWLQGKQMSALQRLDYVKA